MRTSIRIISLLFILVSLSFAQYGKIRWNDLSPAVRDSIRHYVTIDEDFARSIAEDVYDVFYVDSTVTRAELQAIFDQFDESNIKLIFHKGTYEFDGATYPIIARNIRNLVIEGNGALIKFVGTPASGYYMGFYGWECNVGGTGFRLTDDIPASWFADNLYEDSVSVWIVSPDSFAVFDLQKGDMIILTDSTQIPQTFETSHIQTGDCLYFDHFDTLAGPTYKMYFERPSTFTILCKDSLQWSQVVPISNRSLTINNLKVINGGIVVNGLERFTISDSEMRTEQDTASLIVAAYAIATSQTRYILVNNYQTKNHIRLGMGYGLTLADFEYALVNNYTAQNCIHGISTTTSNSSALCHALYVNNYTYSARWVNDFTKAVNNHGGILFESFTNCYVDGANEAFDLRARRSVMKNITVKNGDQAITVCTDGFRQPYHRDECDIDGLWVYRCNHAVYLEDSFAKTIKLNNINMYANTGYGDVANGTLIFYNTPYSILPKHYLADSILVTNSFYRCDVVNPTSLYSVINTGGWGSMDSMYAGYIKLSNCNFSGFHTLINNAKTATRDMVFENCDFSRFDYLMNGTIDTNATMKRFGRLEFNNCEIRGKNSSYSWSGNWHRFTNLIFKGSSIYGVSPGLLRYIYADTVAFIDNKFYKTSGYDMFSTGSYDNKVGYYNVIDNKIFGKTQSTNIFNIDGDVTNLYVAGNFLNCHIKRLAYIVNTNLQMIDNIFMPDSGFVPTTAKFYTNGGVTGSVIGNTFLYNKDDNSYFTGFKINGSTDSLYFDNNSFILGQKARKHVSQRLFDISSGAEVKLGTNRFEGWYGTWSTGSGTFLKSRFLWNNVLLDSISTTNRTDTLSIYSGGDEYVMPKK